MRLLASIGLDDSVVASLRARVDARVVGYPMPPRIEVVEGRVRLESPHVAGRFIEPAGVVYYSYFEGAQDLRRALALALTPSFPDVRATLPLDDKITGLVMGTHVDGSPVARGYLPTGASATWEGERVVKWGDRHCGEGKARATGGFTAMSPTVIEPFLEGESERILVVGDRAWHLRYTSDDWRKNVRAHITVVEPSAAALVERTQRIATALGLTIAGVDYIVTGSHATMLEVNAYPGFDDVPGGDEAFVELAAAWWQRLLDDELGAGG